MFVGEDALSHDILMKGSTVSTFCLCMREEQAIASMFSSAIWVSPLPLEAPEG